MVSSILNSACVHLWALAVWGKSPGFFSYGKPIKKKISIHLNQAYARILLTSNWTSKNGEGAHQYVELYLILCFTKPWSNIIIWLMLQGTRSKHWTHLQAEAVIYRCALDKICNTQVWVSLFLSAVTEVQGAGKQRQRRMDWIWWTLLSVTSNWGFFELLSLLIHKKSGVSCLILYQGCWGTVLESLKSNVGCEDTL